MMDKIIVYFRPNFSESRLSREPEVFEVRQYGAILDLKIDGSFLIIVEKNKQTIIPRDIILEVETFNY